MHRFTVSLSAAALVSVGPITPGSAASPAFTACQLNALSVPADAETSQVTAGDPTGHWLAGHFGIAPSTRTGVVRWHDGHRSTIEVPRKYPYIVGINAHGDVAGIGGEAGFNAHPFAVIDGVYTQLDSPGLHEEYVTGISRGGQVSGYRDDYHGKIQAVVWDVSDPDHPTVLKTPGPGGAGARGINTDGQVAVTASVRETGQSYVFDADGTRQRLRRADPDLAAPVQAIGQGWAAGSENTGTQSLFLRWDLTTHKRPGVIDAPMAAISAVNSAGDMSGWAAGALPGLLIGAEVVTLPVLPGDTHGGATAIANDGNAAGYSGKSADGSLADTAVTWTC